MEHHSQPRPSKRVRFPVMVNELGERVTLPDGSSPWCALRSETSHDTFGAWNCLTGETMLLDEEALACCTWTWEEVVARLADRTYYPLWPHPAAGGCPIVFPGHMPDIDW